VYQRFVWSFPTKNVLRKITKLIYIAIASSLDTKDDLVVVWIYVETNESFQRFLSNLNKWALAYLINMNAFWSQKNLFNILLNIFSNSTNLILSLRGEVFDANVNFKSVMYAEGRTLLHKRMGLIKAYSSVLKVTSLLVTRN
jgi:hypothetical protein